MTEREAQLRAFLGRTDWAGAERAALAGDASNRRYERLSDPATRQGAILMDAPPDTGEDVGPFIEIARFLRAAGLSAPDILAQDRQAGFLILEDLGDDLFARVVAARPDLEVQLYETATDVLVALHRATPPALAEYGPALMTELAALASRNTATAFAAHPIPPPGRALKAGLSLSCARSRRRCPWC